MYNRATEEAIIMFMHDNYLIQLEELNDTRLNLEFEKAPCTIYLVCTRPRLSIDLSYYKITGNSIQLKFYAQIRETKIDFLIDVNIQYKYSEITIESEYPYNFFYLKNPDGEIFAGGKTGYFANKFIDRKRSLDFLDQKVLYIGQSLDNKSDKPLKKRLLNHSTLQKIYAEAVKNNPDKEIYILLASFDQDNIVHSPYNVELTKENEKLDVERLLRLMKNPSRFTLEQRTNFTEAALIRYFRPEYNDKYKDNFPDSKHRSYTECYDLDVSQISVEVNTEDSGYRLYSDCVDRKEHHVARYHMQSSNDRRKMFEELL